jgi:hypothetical protein
MTKSEKISTEKQSFVKPSGNIYTQNIEIENKKDDIHSKENIERKNDAMLIEIPSSIQKSLNEKIEEK